LSVTPFTRTVFSVNPLGILEVLSCVTCPLLFLFFSGSSAGRLRLL